MSSTAEDWNANYLAAGWSVFPCHSITVNFFGEVMCSCPKGTSCTSPGKHPRTRSGVKEATNRSEMVHRWRNAFGTSMNPAIATGAISGIVVIDIDPRDGGDESWAKLFKEHRIPATLTQSTGGGGEHHVFRYPADGRIRNWVGFRDGIDVRSDGGYIIGAPGEHISGGAYSWQNWGARPREMPESLIEALRAPQISRRRVGTGSADAPGVFSAPTSPLPTFEAFCREGLPLGARNHTMHRLACSWWSTLGLEAVAEVERRTWLVWQATAGHDSFPYEEALRAVESARRFIETQQAQTREFLRRMLGGGRRG